jgi:hypothetical protein
VIYAAIVANLGIAAAKFVVAALTGSAAMLAEGIHSAVDTGNELLLLIGEKRQRPPADAAPPLRLRQGPVFLGADRGLSVFALGGGLSIYHGIDSLRAPEPLRIRPGNYVVLGVSAVRGLQLERFAARTEPRASPAPRCGRRSAPARMPRCSPSSSRIRRR